MIVLEDIAKVYRKGAREVRALDGVDLAVKPGEYVVVEGPSGSGKTTLLFIIAGLVRPTGGTVTVDGKSLGAMSASALAEMRKGTFGFVFQMFHLIPYLTALENVCVPLGLAGVSPEEARTKARVLLNRFGLAERAGHYPAEMSAGEKQRVAIARAVANDPPIILADEPTGNLDRRAAEEVSKAFAEINAGGTAIVVVTHDARMIENAPRVLGLEAGKLVKT